MEERRRGLCVVLPLGDGRSAAARGGGRRRGRPVRGSPGRALLTESGGGGGRSGGVTVAREPGGCGAAGASRLARRRPSVSASLGAAGLGQPGGAAGAAGPGSPRARRRCGFLCGHGLGPCRPVGAGPPSQPCGGAGEGLRGRKRWFGEWRRSAAVLRSLSGAGP